MIRAYTHPMSMWRRAGWLVDEALDLVPGDMWGCRLTYKLPKGLRWWTDLDRASGHEFEK